jgi:polysaccharide biosynthesis protein PslH
MEIIFLTSRFPFPLNKGDKLRAYHQIKELSKKNNIHLISISDQKIFNDELNELKNFCSSVHIFYLSKTKIFFNLLRGLFNNKPFQVNYFFSYSAKKKINSLIKTINPDHIFCQLIRCAWYLKDEYNYPKTLDYMDALSKGMERRIEGSGWKRFIFKIENERLKQFENLSYEFFDNHTIISQADQEYIPHEKKTEIKVIPNGIDTDFFKKNNTKPNYDLVFIGNLSYAPNVDVVEYIYNDLLEKLIEIRPEIKILISGSNPSKKILKYTNKNITIQEWIPDIRTAYNNGKIFIAPLRIGTGLQNKLLEAMSLQLPCITTDLANMGLGAEHGKELFIANNDKEFVEIIEKLLNSKDTMIQIGENARAFVKSNFDWEKSSDELMKNFSIKRT